MTQKIHFSIYLLLFAAIGFSQELIHPIRAINSDDTDFSDLSFLSNVLQGNRIVALGEQSHSDGATFDAKVRLIKYLHEELNYNVIAFESGLYDCSKANELIKNREIGNDTNYLFQAIFSVWDCKEVNKLATYLDETQKTPYPLTLSGFDCQFAGKISRNYFINDFYQFVSNIEKFSNQDLKLDTTQLNKSFRLYMKYSNYFKKLSSEDTSIIHTSITKILNVIDNKHITNNNVSYWKQLFNSIQVDYRRKYHSTVSRDAMMAENVEWLANNKFKNQKIILWAANTHIVSSTQSVKSKYLSSHTLMGNYLSNNFGQQYYSLAFTSFNGKVLGKWFWDMLIMGKAKRKSIESYFYKTNYDYAFINIRGQHDKNNPYFFNSKIFGHTPRDMNLYDVVDGVFYIEKMYPATRKY